MGEGIGVKCNNCGNTEDFLLGVGFSYYPLDNVIKFTHGKARKTLQDIVSKDTITETDYEHVLFACPHCNTLHSRFYVKVEYDKGKVYETAFRCGKCRASLVRAEQPVSYYNCKQCGQKSLEQECEMLWD